MNRQLGKAVSALIAATFDDSDYLMESECNGFIYSHQLREWDKVAQAFGFRDRHHLIREVERRTSERWVYFRLPIH